MRLTVSQLRRIIKEEVQHCILRNAVREALVGGADRRMSGGGIETAMSAGRQTPQPQEMELLKKDIAAQKAQIKKVKAGKMRGQDLVAMEDHLAELEAKLAAMKASPVKESFRSSMRGTRLSEAHARITAKELAAWSNGDWGYISESDDEEY